LKAISYLLDKTQPISYVNLNEAVLEFAGLSLHELQNIRCTSEQHKVIGFLIDIKKMNDEIISCKNDFSITEINRLYKISLKINSPVESDTIL
jgi:hypothetical protein